MDKPGCQQLSIFEHHNRHSILQLEMASARQLTTTFSARLSAPPRSCTRLPRISSPTAAVAFSTTALRFATPLGPPPAGFRLPRKERWDEAKESSLDKAGRYFLLTEMMRGMYVVLEQFFRPPYDKTLKATFISSDTTKLLTDIQYTIRLRKARSRLASAASTLYGDTLQEKSAALRANFAKQFALLVPLPSKQRSVRTVAGGRYATI